MYTFSNSFTLLLDLVVLYAQTKVEELCQNCKSNMTIIQHALCFSNHPSMSIRIQIQAKYNDSHLYEYTF